MSMMLKCGVFGLLIKMNFINIIHIRRSFLLTKREKFYTNTGDMTEIDIISSKHVIISYYLKKTLFFKVGHVNSKCDNYQTNYHR